VRRFWRGDAGLTSNLAGYLLGSSNRFDHSGRPATSSINFLTAHDGFTLDDLVSFTVKRNFANGEDNRDGHCDNHADNLGVEGATDDPVILAARALRKRNLLATLMVSQGVPMLLSGDEIGHSQGGNNNAYAQDNAVTWLDWAKADTSLTAFIARLVALRAGSPVLRQRRFLHGRLRADGLPDVVWLRPDGVTPAPQDWHDPGFRALGVVVRMAAEGGDASADAALIYLNCGAEVPVTLPPGNWRLMLDTTRPDGEHPGNPLLLPAQSVLMFQAVNDAFTPQDGKTP